LANRNLLLTCSKVTFGSHDRIWLDRDYVAGGMFGYTPLDWDLWIFLFCLIFPDFPRPLSFFVFISPVIWLPYLSFVHCPLLTKKKKKIVASRFFFDFLASPADELWHFFSQPS